MKHTFDHHPGFNKVVLLFRGMFRDPGFGRILAAAFDGTRRPLEVVTVIADPQFDFPSVDVYETETKAFPVQWWHVDDDDDDDDDGGELGLFRWMYAKRHRIYALGFSVHFFELQNVTWAVLKKPGWLFYWAVIWGLFHIPSRIRLLRSRISWFMSVDFDSSARKMISTSSAMSSLDRWIWRVFLQSDAVLDHNLKLIGLEVVALSSGYEVDIRIFIFHPQICKLFLKYGCNL